MTTITTPLTKRMRARVKATGEEDGVGGFKALIATYDTDSVGDRIIPGAFQKSLARWEESGNCIPVIWSHDWANPESHIGVVDEARETEVGLVVDGTLDLDEARAAKVYRLMKGNRINQFSFAYDIIEGGPAKLDGEDVMELRELELHEVGPTLLGVNRRTELLDVKTADREPPEPRSSTRGLTEWRVRLHLPVT